MMGCPILGSIHVRGERHSISDMFLIFHTKPKVIFINLSSEFILLLLLKVINQTSVVSACEFCVFTGNEDTGGLSAIE